MSEQARLMKCTCKHKYQEEKYGEGMRVFSRTTKQDGKTWRCSICTHEVTTGEADSKKKGKKS